MYNYITRVKPKQPYFAYRANQEYMTEDMETEQILVSFGQGQVEGSFLQDCLCQSLKTDKN